MIPLRIQRLIVPILDSQISITSMTNAYLSLRATTPDEVGEDGLSFGAESLWLNPPASARSETPRLLHPSRSFRSFKAWHKESSGLSHDTLFDLLEE